MIVGSIKNCENVYTYPLTKHEHSQYSIYRIDHQHIKTNRVMKNWVK